MHSHIIKLIMTQSISKERVWAFGVLGGITLLYLTKRYFAGGRCSINQDLSRKVALITGGNTGIGKQTARRLVEMGCFVIIGARDLKKNQATVEQLNALKKGEVVSFHLDLAKRDSINQFSNNVKNVLRGRSIQYLVNNAGIMRIPTHTKTAEGAQIQMGVNHLGHFLLTHLLWKEVKEAENPRIINVSSLAHTRGSAINFDDLGFQLDQYQPGAAYSRSKKANILFTKQLQKRMNEQQINGISLSLHPGVVRTQLARDVLNTPMKKIIFYSLATLPSLIFFKSSMEGAQTTLYTILEDQSKLEKGQYYADCKRAEIKTDQCRDPDSGRQLWEASERYWGIKFDL